MSAAQPSPINARPAELRALVALARSASEESPSSVLGVVAETIFRLAGYRTVVLNVFRPVEDDFEAVLVVGGQESRETLLHTTTPRSTVEQILRDGDQLVPSVYFIAAGRSEMWETVDGAWVPDLPVPEADTDWQARDGLLMMLSDRDGSPLGLLSMDEPRSGRRPGFAEAELLGLIGSFAEQALRSARRAEAAELKAVRLSGLTAMSPQLSDCDTVEDLDRLIVAIIVTRLGFESVAIYRPEEHGTVRVTAHHGSIPHPAAATELMTLVPALGSDGERATAGWLITPSACEDRSGSQDQASGVQAWRGNRLLFSWQAPDTGGADLRNLVVLDEPSNRLLPSGAQRQAIRVLLDLAASVERSIVQRRRLDHLSSHDPLTGVRNRRGLEELVRAYPDVTVLLCDLDHFKQVNDCYGHHLGDEVLAHFGSLLNDIAGNEGTAIRLGGEEFCVLLPGADGDRAREAAASLAAATRAGLRDLVPGGATVSIGIALSDCSPINVRELLTAADRALYEAKRTGRDRICVSPRADAPDMSSDDPHRHDVARRSRRDHRRRHRD